MKKLGELNQQGATGDKELAELRRAGPGRPRQPDRSGPAQGTRVENRGQSVVGREDALERQLKGQSPWYLEKVPAATVAARSPDLFDLLIPQAHAGQADNPAPRSVRVTVVTDAALANTGTSNQVYFIVGNRKYQISGPESPLTNASPQVIALDLLAGPLDSSDLRGFGLGMLAPPTPRGKGPDRWHPVRVQVEADGKTVYDSEQVPTDRQTLAAIRLVPPSQLDLDGSVVKNPSNRRELYVWEAGRVTGFDPATGNVDPLPPGTITKNGEVSGGFPPAGTDTTPKEPPIKPLAPADLMNLTQKNTPMVPQDPQPFNPPLPPQQPVVNINVFPGENPLNKQPQIIFIQPIVPGTGAVDPANVTKPVNPPIAPQIGTVHFVQLRRSVPGFCTLAISWSILDESGVDHYDVSLQGMEDDLSSIGLLPRTVRRPPPCFSAPAPGESTSSPGPCRTGLSWTGVS